MNGPKDMFKGFMLVSFLALIVFSLVACTQPATESSAEDLEGTDSIVSLSSEAKEKLDELYPEMEENQVWRIYGAGSGWGGPTFEMALDEPEEDDLRLEVDGHKFIMHPQLQEDFGKFAVDYVDSIFDRFIVTVDF